MQSSSFTSDSAKIYKCDTEVSCTKISAPSPTFPSELDGFVAIWEPSDLRDYVTNTGVIYKVTLTSDIKNTNDKNLCLSADCSSNSSSFFFGHISDSTPPGSLLVNASTTNIYPGESFSSTLGDTTLPYATITASATGADFYKATALSQIDAGGNFFQRTTSFLWSNNSSFFGTDDLLIAMPGLFNLDSLTPTRNFKLDIQALDNKLNTTTKSTLTITSQPVLDFNKRYGKSQTCTVYIPVETASTVN